MSRLFLFLVLMGNIFSVSAYYQCEYQGKMSFSDVPCPEHAKQIKPLPTPSSPNNTENVTSNHQSMQSKPESFAEKITQLERYLDMDGVDVARIFNTVPNQAGNVIVAEGDRRILFEAADGDKITFILMELLNTGPCDWDTAFNSDQMLLDIGYDPEELIMTRWWPHAHIFSYLNSKYYISFGCDYTGAPYSFSIKLSSRVWQPN
ncbi:hypothetical protein [uncultured Shewanella sp.]|uniref:hypothetical protein n=1 Tax=uncultured Shewanella sp. TaxID=173975 RepID=UPI00263745FA|nr:hypothetical protein [uncultured Shewanella sp.]